MTAIISFLGSAVFRWLLEKVFGLMERKQDHEQELELRKQQEEIDSASHARNLELLVKRSELKIQETESIVRGAIEEREVDAFVESIKSAGKPSGNKIIDAWNAAIRPFVATMCIVMLIALLIWLIPPFAIALDGVAKVALATMLVEYTLALIATVIGWFFGSRGVMPGKK